MNGSPEFRSVVKRIQFEIPEIQQHANAPLVMVLAECAVRNSRGVSDVHLYRVDGADYVGFSSGGVHCGFAVHPGGEPGERRSSYVLRVVVGGRFKGRWQFEVSGPQVHATHNGKICPRFRRLQGAELLRAVINSSFAEPRNRYRDFLGNRHRRRKSPGPPAENRSSSAQS
jgi:hypothetical protein